MQTAKTLIRLGECPGWSESLLGAQPFCCFCYVVAQICSYHLFSFLAIFKTDQQILLFLKTKYLQSNLNWTKCSLKQSKWEITYRIFNTPPYLNGKHNFVSYYTINKIWATSWQNQQNDCAPSEDSDQPGHPPSLIRVFAVCSMGS